jgi:hypothetical protein
MAIVPGVGHLLVGQPEIAEAAQRALSMKGQLPTETDQRYGLGVTVADLTDPEYWWLRRGTRWGVGVNTGAVAAQFSIACLQTQSVAPQAALVILDEVIICNAGVAGTFSFGVQWTGPGFALTSTPNVADGRQLQAAFTPYAQAGGGTNAVSQIQASQPAVQLAANSFISVKGPFILGGKDNGITGTDRFIVQNNTVNNNMLVTFLWRERAELVTER